VCSTLSLPNSATRQFNACMAVNDPCATSINLLSIMQVNLYKQDALTSEEFFLREKKLVLHLVENRDSVKFKVYARHDDYGDYLIKCRGCYRGGYVASYKLLKSIGPLDLLYSVVAEQLLRTIAGVYDRDREIISNLPRFRRRHILTTDRIYG
jgi:hypothetical protein